MQKVLHETCEQYVARRLSEGWRIISQDGFNVVLQSPEGIIRPVDLRNDVETLRPNAAGDETAIPSQYPYSTYHWDKVDEASPDDNTTYVGSSSSSWLRDLYNLPVHSIGSGTINSITIYIRGIRDEGNGYYRVTQKSGSTVTDGSSSLLNTSWTTKSQTYTTNPATGVAYTWAEIDALQIGAYIAGNGSNSCLITQVYVEVDYTVVVYIPPRGFYQNILAH